MRSKLAGFLTITVLAFGLTPAAAIGEGISFVEPSASPLTFPNGGGVAGTAHADFDGDGHQDVAVTQNTNIAGVGGRGYISILLGDGAGSFAEPQHIAMPTDPVVSFGAGIVATDLVGSAAADVAVASPQLNAILVFEGNGDGTFGDPESLPTSASPVGLVSGNLDGEGKLDLATYYSGTDAAAVLLNGAAGFVAAEDYPVGTNPQAVAIANLDAGGEADLVVGTYDTKTLDVFLNNGDGTLADAVASDARVQVSGLWVGDFNNDGDTDAVVSGFAPSGEGALCFANCVEFLAGNGDGTFAPGTNDRIYAVRDYPGLHYSDNLATDLNGDGRPDVIFGHDAINTVTVGFSNADGSLDVTEYVASPGPGFVVDYPDSARPTSVAVADFNEDGKPDIAVGTDQTNPRPGGVSLLLGGGTAGFQSPRSYSTPRIWTDGSTRGATLADFNNDDDPDVVAITDALDFLPGNGDGSFGEASVALGRISGPGEFYNTIRSADFDGDGNMDVAWSATDGVQGGPNPRNVVAFGTGNGAFTDVTFLAPRVSDWGGRNLVVGDFDGDTHPDLAVWTKALFGSVGEIDVYLYNPDAPRTFTTGPVLDLGGTDDFPGFGMTAVDINGDDDIDLITHMAAGFSSAAEQLFVFLGNGDGTFADALVTSPGLPDVLDLTGADVDGDGKVDLIGAGSNQVDVMSGNGDGTFDAPVAYGAGIAAGFVQPVDLDLDGVLDLAVGHFGCTCANGFGVLPGQGDGTFGTYKGFAVAGSVLSSMALEDLTGDGKLDVVIGHGGAVAQVSVLFNESVATVATHERSVSLKLKGHLTAHGSVSVEDGTTSCVDDVQVTIQKKAGKKWKTVAKTHTKPAVSGSSSKYKTEIPDKAGKYRAKVSKLKLSETSICTAATSPPGKGG